MAIFYFRGLTLAVQTPLVNSSEEWRDVTLRPSGHEGKPYYVSGPNHSEFTAQRIITHLKNRFGSDGFHYLVGIDDLDTDDLLDG